MKTCQQCNGSGIRNEPHQVGSAPVCQCCDGTGKVPDTADEILHKIGTHPAIVEVVTTPARAFMMIAQLQLALRHPYNTGSSAAFAKEMAENLAKVVCHYVPEAAELIAQGWDESYDTTAEYYNLEFLSPLPDDLEP
jgi:hypothetical protein